MGTETFVFSEPVTLVGGGDLSAGSLAAARRVAPRLVAADGAADKLWNMGFCPDLVVGDMDSLASPGRWRSRSARLHPLTEQDTTDFEKCLYSVDAPAFVAAGFTGRRHDHALAVLSAMPRFREKRIVLLGEADAVAHLPGGVELAMPIQPGARVSLFPMAPVRGVVSEGLAWSVAGLELAPAVRIGTSNRATGDTMRVKFDGDGMLLMIDSARFGDLFTAVMALSIPAR